MNPNLDLLHSYPFEKLSQLFKGLTPPAQAKADCFVDWRT
jgi:hypothetical protein